MKRPRLLLADEPTSQLDAESSHSIADLIREVALSGTAVLVAAHDEGLSASADRVVHMKDGRIGDGRGSSNE